MPRLFTGLELPAHIGQSLSTLRGGLPGARWIDPENYHVTLRFIGDVDETVAHEVASLLGRVRRPSFELHVEDLKSFGGRKPRALVATLGPEQALMELQAEHERLMQRVGLEPDGRKFVPHVTLARLRESSSRQVADYLSLRAPLQIAAIQCLAIRPVFIPRVDRWRSLRDRGLLPSDLMMRRRAGRTEGRQRFLFVLLSLLRHQVLSIRVCTSNRAVANPSPSPRAHA